jgi:hypothetical protein
MPLIDTRHNQPEIKDEYGSFSTTEPQKKIIFGELPDISMLL